LQKRFKLNAPIDCSKCPNFLFDFRLKDAAGVFMKQPIVVEQGKKIDIVQDVNYVLEYEVWNREKKGRSYQNISLDFSELNSDNNRSIDLSPSSFLIPNFENNTSFSGPAISIRPRRTADIAKVISKLSVPEDGNGDTCVEHFG